jgi:XRE family aerobic/anaerobic benzoate catabolism transcriptional regulator
MANIKKQGSSNPNPENIDSNPFLVALGQRVRTLRDRSGITRKTLSSTTGVSERHLANLEYGTGNVSVLVLQQVAVALHCSFAELIGDFTTASPEWLMIRSLLENRDEQTLYKARHALGEILGSLNEVQSSNSRIALIGLRGAGKSTLGQRLAAERDLPFVELSRDIEQIAGCSIAEIQDMYGASAYCRYERQAMQQAIQNHKAVVIATPGGLVSDPANFNLLLSNCQSVWLQANPADHMQRVIEQGDFRPMAGSSEAMEDLKGILAAREPFYSRAQYRLDTSQQSLDETFALLSNLVKPALDMANENYSNSRIAESQL